MTSGSLVFPDGGTAEIHLARQSAGFSNPTCHWATGLHEPALPSRSQVRTFQKQRSRDANGLPSYVICELSSAITLPLSQRSPMFFFKSSWEEATRIR